MRMINIVTIKCEFFPVGGKWCCSCDAISQFKTFFRLMLGNLYLFLFLCIFVPTLCPKMCQYCCLVLLFLLPASVVAVGRTHTAMWFLLYTWAWPSFHLTARSLCTQLYSVLIKPCPIEKAFKQISRSCRCKDDDNTSYCHLWMLPVVFVGAHGQAKHLLYIYIYIYSL